MTTVSGTPRLTPEAVVAAVSERPPWTVLVHGPAGIGKTRVLRAAADSLRNAGWRVHMVTGSSAGHQVPLGGFLSLPGLGPRPAPGEVIELLASQRSRSVLIVDGVDLLDEVSQFVVAHLVRDARYRTILSTRNLRHVPAFTELYDAGDLTALELGPLTEADCLAMAQDLLGGRVTPSAGRLLVDRSKGNPLVLREVLGGSQQRGSLVHGAHGWEFVGAPATTPRLDEMVGARLESLSPDAARVASILAAGGTLPAKVLDRLAVEELRAAGVVDLDADDVASLQGPLFADTLRHGCPEPQWRDICRDAARRAREASMLDDEEPRRELALRATALSLDAGEPVPTEDALELAAHADALQDHSLMARAAVHVLEAEPTHPEAHRLAGIAASARGDVDTALRHLDRPLTDESPEVRLATARALAEHRATRGQDAPAAAQLLQDVLASTPAQTQDRRLAENDLVRWQYAAGLAAVLPTPVDAKEPSSHAHSLLTAAFAACLTGPLDEAKRSLRDLGEMVRDPHPASPMLPDLARLAEVMAMSYDADVVATRQRGLRELHRDTRDHPELVGTWQFTLGVLEFFAADASVAHRHAEEAVANLAWRDPIGAAPAAAALAYATGTALGAAEAANHRRNLPEAALADPKVAMLLRWADARRQWRSGSTNAAAQTLLTAAADLQVWRHVFFAGILAHCAAKAGAAEQALEILEPAARDASGGLVRLLHRHANAVAGRDLDGLATVAEELHAFGNIGSAADTALLLSRLHAADGDNGAARRWELWFREVLGEAPTAVTWTERPPAEGLTDRELEVARLAAARLSAKEIAARLGTSPNTVNNQLTAIYRKLGLRGRKDLAGMFDF